MEENITIRELTIKDKSSFPTALELLNRTQGRDLFPEHYIDRKMNDPLCHVIAGFLGEELVSIAVAEVLHDFKYYIPFDENIVEELQNKVVGSFSTMCVREDLQGKGVGKKMSQIRLDWLKDRGCEVIVGISWVSGKSHTSDRVFEKMGFGMVKSLDNFFYEQSLQNPFQCPGCGAPPCTCPAMLYRLDLDR